MKLKSGGSLSKNSSGIWQFSKGTGENRIRKSTGERNFDKALIKAKQMSNSITLNNKRLYSKVHKNDYIRVFKESKKRAKKASIDYNISDIEQSKLINRCSGCCEVTGIKFRLMRNKKPKERDPFMPSLDRIDSSKCYSYNNVRLVCISVNLAMNTWGDWVLKEICLAMIHTKGIHKELSTMTTIGQHSKTKGHK
ncbi:MAG: hypothetical protein ACRBHB_17205 [Arenicella sp.]